MSVAVVSKSQPVPQLGHIRTAAHGFSQELLSLAGAVLSQELLSFFECRRAIRVSRSEEHTSELQSRLHLVCRLLLEKKKTATRSVKRSAGKIKIYTASGFSPQTKSFITYSSLHSEWSAADVQRSQYISPLSYFATSD